MRSGVILFVAICASLLPSLWAQEIPSIERRIPPKGIEIPEDVRKELSESLLQGWEQYEASEADHRDDAGVLLKGVELALVNGEFYGEKDFEIARRHLSLAKERLQAPQQGGGPLTVQGYASSVDGSLQPYGLEIPEGLDTSKPVSLLVWLHGRGDKVTDLHFIERCLNKSQAFQGKLSDQTNYLVLHPFGRQCIGWKHAGEIDVLEAIAAVQSRYKVDPDRVVLAGFSMGGAGAWHIGAHYTDHFAAVHAGAGFAETARYTNLAKEDYPVWYEQKLWGAYDVPNYARNLLNLPVVAYSGEEDKQKQAADVMAEALASHGHELRHIIGPGMGHKYHDDSVAPVLEVLNKARRVTNPEQIEFQTQTLRYSGYHWLEVTELKEHWADTRVSAKRVPNWELTTQNVRALSLEHPFKVGEMVKIDDQSVAVADPTDLLELRLTRGTWEIGPPKANHRKKPGLQGPIDDGFMSAFLVVMPSKESANPKVQRWLEFETEHFAKRWRELFRGSVRVCTDADLSKEDIANYNLICWGEPSTNSFIRKVLEDLPLDWNAKTLLIGETEVSAKSHVPAMIYPNPLNRSKYLVINSGPTFREGHDSTNSKQNPKLPDWAILDLSQDPDQNAPGKVVVADFFDERWRLKTDKP